ncbi:TPA: fimbrial protein [Escherichia coli]
MNKTIMSLFIASMVFSGSALAAAAANDTSTAQLNFTGKVTSNLCQLSTASQSGIDIDLGEVSVKDLNANNRSRAQTFTVDLKNCDTSVNKIQYQVSSQNPGDTDYISPVANDTAATGVGVYIQTADAASPTAIRLGNSYNASVIQNVDGSGAAADQQIALQAYMKKAGNATVTAGSVNAVGYVTVKASAVAVGGS